MHVSVKSLWVQSLGEIGMRVAQQIWAQSSDHSACALRSASCARTRGLPDIICHTVGTLEGISS